jgi:hypothetical protein
VIPHPFGNRSRQEVEDIAHQCARDIASLVSREAALEP